MTRRGEAFSGRGSSGTVDESKVTSKGQLTLPKTAHAALGVGVGDTVRFVMQDNKIVVDTDSGFPADMMEAMKSLVSGIEVDLEAPIEGDVVI